jgi:branched-chain amino acid transport system permease protein
MNYFFHLLILLEIYSILALSLNLLVGFAGSLTLAHGAFFGIGAYITALLLVSGRIGFVPAALLAVGGTASIASLLGLASLRFKGDRFVLASLAFQVLLTAVLVNWVRFTQGPFGIAGIPRPVVLGLRLVEQRDFAWFSTLISGGVLTFLVGVCRSPFGRALRAMRDDETALRVLGKPVIWLRFQAMTVSSGCAAAAGALYACYVRFVDPSSFTLDESIIILSMVVVGGSGNLRGPVIGAVVLTLLPEALRFASIPSASVGNVRMLVYGLALIVSMRYRPQGLAGDYPLD